jgi:glycosyltransferase involved in cell wall biosynthesis
LVRINYYRDGNKAHFTRISKKTLNIADKVIFTGRIPNATLPNYLKFKFLHKHADYRRGISLLDLTAGTELYPIVTDIAGNQSWINHRENGQLVTVNDFKMLANNLGPL